MRIDDNGSPGSGQAAAPVATDWEGLAPRLAAHFSAQQNRTDVHGAYRSKSSRKPDPKTGRTSVSFTAHAGLTVARLVRHFVGKDHGHLIGLHVSSPAETCRRIVIDFDAHGDGDDPEANWKMALAVYIEAKALGFDVLLLDSNGRGGFHLWLIFARPVPMGDAWRLGRWMVRGFASFGLTKAPESFPKSPRLTGKRIGHWVRLPGCHHTRDHWTRVWDGGRWLDRKPAVRVILAHTGKDVDIGSIVSTDFDPGRRVSRPRKQAGATPNRTRDDALARRHAGAAPNRRRDLVLACEALNFLGDDFRDNYDRWLGVGLALSELGDAGLALWHTWSTPSSKYEPSVLDAKWAGFTPGHGASASRLVTLGSLLHLAREEGWPGPPRRVRGVTRHRGSISIRVTRRAESTKEGVGS